MVNTRSKSKKEAPQPPSKPSPLPKKQTPKTSPKNQIQKVISNPKSVVFSLRDAYVYFDTLKLDDSTKENYKERIRFICEDFDTDDLNVIFGNPDKVIENIRQMKWRNNPNKTISLETQKAYLIAVRVLTQRGAIPSVDVEKRKVYQKAMLDKAKETGEIRGKNLRKSNLKDHPNLKYEDLIEKRNEFDGSAYMTLNNLKALLIVSLYTLLRPRRLEYRLLQYYSKEPTIEKEKCYLVSNKNRTTLKLNEFKTRTYKQHDFLPMYVKDLPPKLVSLFKLWIKKNKLKDGDYIFKNTNGDMYESDAFSKQVGQAFQKVCGAKVLVNDLRHLYITFLADHIQDYNNNDLKQIAISVGDYSILTALNYRLTQRENEDDTITQIQHKHLEKKKQQIQAIVDAEEEGSVQGGGENVDMNDVELSVDDEEEISSPQQKVNLTKDKYALIEYVLMEVKKILLKVL
jgi:hypothetical protein